MTESLTFCLYSKKPIDSTFTICRIRKRFLRTWSSISRPASRRSDTTSPDRANLIQDEEALNRNQTFVINQIRTIGRKIDPIKCASSSIVYQSPADSHLNDPPKNEDWDDYGITGTSDQPDETTTRAIELRNAPESIDRKGEKGLREGKHGRSEMQYNSSICPLRTSYDQILRKHILNYFNYFYCYKCYTIIA